MEQKKVAVLFYPWFSNYEMNVALSVLFQAEKPYDLIGLAPGAVASEEGGQSCAPWAWPTPTPPGTMPCC